MHYEQILVEQRDEVLLLTLNRPEKLNAWTQRMRRELTHAIDRANGDPGVGAFVLTGAGRGFCAGADIEEAFHRRLAAGGEAAESNDQGEVRDWVQLVRESKPAVAAINGVAVGVGITQVLPFDVLVASTEARVGMFFVRMGLVPELASSHFLVQRVGFARASEMCLTGRLYPAEELASTGLFNRVVPPERLLEEALGLAREMAANPEPALRMTKRLLSENGSEQDLARVQRREIEALGVAYQTPEHREAVQAFLEKRKPAFRAKR